MNFKYWIIIVTTINLTMTSCAGAQTKQAEQKPKEPFVLPQIPSTLTVPAQRAAYLVKHYWDHFNFADTTLANRPEITEQAFADFLTVLNELPIDQSAAGVKEMMRKAEDADSVMFACFSQMAAKYLHDPNSPYRNEAYYIPVLEHLVASPKVSQLDKIRPKRNLEMALKNRPGMLAADFDYALRNGKQGRLHQLGGDYTILFFNNPDCHDCKRVKELLEQTFTKELYLAVNVLALYPDEDLELWRKAEYPAEWVNGYDKEQVIVKKELYDLKAIPCLYLLDKSKTVLLKDAPVEAVIGYLQQQSRM